MKINKPLFDDRELYGDTLNNNIKLAIIHDKNLIKSYVTVSINVGSFADPKEYQGLAHFLEHMLFMGSEKYPDEQYYFKRLNQLGGTANAYTDVMNTVYFLNVYDNGLEEMLDIFSRFFIDPKFNPDAIKREINAVNNEHNKNINSDFWIKHHLILQLTDKDSVTNKFTTGSLKSLNKPGLRDQLIKFHNKYYTSKNISICIASSKSPKYIKQIIDKTFGQIKDKPQHTLLIKKPFLQNNKSNAYHLKTMSDIYQLTYFWEIPAQINHINTHEFVLLGNILRNKSEKSLYFHLKNKGYLNYINVSIIFEDIFIIELSLTKEGFYNLDYIESTLFKYLHDIINTDFNMYAKYYKHLNKEEFKYSKFNIETLCDLLANNHQIYPTKNILDGSYNIELRSNKEYHRLFTKYINANNYIKIISSQNYPTQYKLNYTQVIEYNTKFAKIKDTKLNSFNKNIELCCFDLNNQFLNLNIKQINGLDKYDIPSLIAKKQWYAGNSNFKEPDIKIVLQFNNDKYFNSPKNYILTTLSCYILNFLSATILFKPLSLLCSLSFVPDSTTTNINLYITSLNDINKLKLVINQIHHLLININIYFDKLSKEYINNLILTLKRYYQNIIYTNPWEYSERITRYLSTDYTSDDLIKIFEIIDYDKIKEYMTKLLNDTSLTTFTYGNIKLNNAKDLFNGFNTLFNNKIYPLPKINKLVNSIIQHPNKHEKSNAITYYYPIGKITYKKRLLLRLSQMILSQLFFDDLRTKNQLGYLVSMNIMVIINKFYIIQKIQSDKDIKLIKSKVKNFNNNIVKYIMDADFNKFKSTLKLELSEPYNNLSDKFSNYYNKIASREYIFNLKEILLEHLQNITQRDILHFVKKYINKQNSKIIIIVGN